MNLNNSLFFCHHCGEDLRAPLMASPDEPTLTPEAVQPASAPRRQVTKREVTTREVEAIWGLVPLPTGISPFGVITDGVSDVPQSLACESNEYKDNKIWELVKGEQKLFDAEAPGMSTTVSKEHLCALDTVDDREALGNSQYGSKK